MKTGVIMAFSAVTLFTGSMIWSNFRMVADPVKKYDREEMERGQAPDRVTTNTHFFESEPAHNIRIDAPVWVELDNRFDGVELQGDTALFHQIWVSTTKNVFMEKSIDIGIRLLNPRQHFGVDSTDGKPTQDFLRRRALSQANLKVRIGVGSYTQKTPSPRGFSFNHCKKVSTLQPLKGSNMDMNFFMTDSIDVHIDADQLTLDFPNFDPQPFTWVRFQGRCRRVAMNNFFNGLFDGSGFVVRDFYVRNLKHADVTIYATDLARVRQIEESNVKVEGNPEYRSEK